MMESTAAATSSGRVNSPSAILAPHPTTPIPRSPTADRVKKLAARMDPPSLGMDSGSSSVGSCASKVTPNCGSSLHPVATTTTATGARRSMAGNFMETLTAVIVSSSAETSDSSAPVTSSGVPGSSINNNKSTDVLMAETRVLGEENHVGHPLSGVKNSLANAALYATTVEHNNNSNLSSAGSTSDKDIELITMVNIGGTGAASAQPNASGTPDKGYKTGTGSGERKRKRREPSSGVSGGDGTQSQQSRAKTPKHQKGLADFFQQKNHVVAAVGGQSAPGASQPQHPTPNLTYAHQHPSHQSQRQLSPVKIATSLQQHQQAGLSLQLPHGAPSQVSPQPHQINGTLGKVPVPSQQTCPGSASRDLNLSGIMDSSGSDNSSGGMSTSSLSPSQPSGSSTGTTFVTFPPPGDPSSYFAGFLEAFAQTELSLSDIAKLEDLNKLVDELRTQVANQQRLMELQNAKLLNCKEVTKKLVIEQSQLERKAVRSKCLEDNLRLGSFRMERHGGGYQEVYVEGNAFKVLRKRQQKVESDKLDIEREKKILTKRKPSQPLTRKTSSQNLALLANPALPSSTTSTATSAGSNSNPAGGPGGIPGPSAGSSNQPASTPAVINCSGSCSPGNSNDGFVKPEPPKDLSWFEFHELDEILKLRNEALKREKQDIEQETERLEREKNLHTRESKRIQNEDQSSYNDYTTLNKRYVLLSLLGKGGFSEVYRAFDLEEMRYVACKIHNVNPEWREEKKANYVKHAMREKDIHKTLEHARIVRLYDVFTINKNSFCTVLEYCDGNDLDFYLKQHKNIPEKEARAIIMQLISALKYMNEIRPPIIHYDLKPANILLVTGQASGGVKITDFGLAKLMTEQDYDPDVGMDLTSQFAGTYWYLPPECFVVGQGPPKISSKVDVWSIGVIFYQCLYGRRRFIRCCLQYAKEDRADVFQLYNHDYLKSKQQSRLQQASAAQQQAQGGASPTLPPSQRLQTPPYNVMSSPQHVQQL